MANEPSETLYELAARLRDEQSELALGGGPKAIERQHSKGRLTARERIDLLIDPGTPVLELGAWSGWKMYDEFGGAPGAGVVTVIGTVTGRRHLIAATVKSGFVGARASSGSVSTKPPRRLQSLTCTLENLGPGFPVVSSSLSSKLLGKGTFPIHGPEGSSR